MITIASSASIPSEVSGESAHCRLFTSTAYTRSVPRNIPLIAQVQSVCLGIRGFSIRKAIPASCLLTRWKPIRVTNLFQIDAHLLARLRADQRIGRPPARPRSHFDLNHFDDFLAGLVHVPRDKYDVDRPLRRIRRLFQDRLQWSVCPCLLPGFPEGGVARVHFIIAAVEGKRLIFRRNS